VIQDKYEGEPQTAESSQKIPTESEEFNQNKDLKRINEKVNEIENNAKLQMTEYDFAELTGIATDGGGILTVWENDNQISKIDEEIGLSYGQVKTVIYLEKGLPIKIIETEENFSSINGELNYNELIEVFRANIYVYDWENDTSKIERIGKRILSEGSCSTFDYEPILERAKKAIE
jgi:hypothetical protein